MSTRFPEREELAFILRRMLDGESNDAINEALKQQMPAEQALEDVINSPRAPRSNKVLQQIRLTCDVTRELLEHDREIGLKLENDPSVNRDRRQHFSKLMKLVETMVRQLALPDLSRLDPGSMQPDSRVVINGSASSWMYRQSTPSSPSVMLMVEEEEDALIIQGLHKHLSALAGGFGLSQWRRRAGELLQLWSAIACEINARYQESSGLPLGARMEPSIYPALGSYHLNRLLQCLGPLDLDLELEISEYKVWPGNLVNESLLHPAGLPAVDLAHGSRKQIAELRRTIVEISGPLLQDRRLHKVTHLLTGVRQQSEELIDKLRKASEKGRLPGTCSICAGWFNSVEQD